MSPVVVHFAAVLFASAVGLMPSHTTASFGLLMGVAAIGGLAYSGPISVRVLKDHGVDLADRLFYGLSPVVAYAIWLVAAGLFFAHSERASEVLAAALVLLLLVNIRNAWDLTIFMVRKHGDQN
jgi:hypothetical protein